MIRGTCLCGGVTYELTPPLAMVMHCHCSMCRKSSGAAFGTSGGVPADGFRWLGGRDLVQAYESSPGAQRPFCRRCGSGVPSSTADGLVFAPLGNLEGDPGQPLAHIFVGSKAPWYTIAGDLPRFDAYPPGIDAPTFAGPSRPVSEPGRVRGSCLCGAVAYQLEGAIEVVRNCHCQRCRRARSAAHASNGFADADRFALTRGADRLESYKIPEAERFTQSFCRSCGSPLPRLFPGRPYVVIPMGSVDGDPGARPGSHIFVDSKAPWFAIADDLPQYPDYPPQ